MDKSHVGMFHCFYCGETMGVLLDRRLKDSLPMDCGAVGYEPCDQCKEWMEQGILLISMKNGEGEKVEKERLKALTDWKREKSGRWSGWEKKNPFESRWMPNPYRTGGWCVITDEALANTFSGPVVKETLRHRWTFVEDEAWDALGLPREDVTVEQAA